LRYFTSKDFKQKSHTPEIIYNPSSKDKYTKNTYSHEEEIISTTVNDSTSNTSSSGISNIVSNAMTSAKKFLGWDEESMEKKRRKNEINSTIDNALKGTGLAGAVFGKFAKVIANKVSDNIVETTSLIKDIQAMTNAYLSKDKNITRFLGDNISCGLPISTSVSAVQYNSQGTTKVANLIMPVKGNLSHGTVKVQAQCNDSNITNIKDITVELSTGQIYKVNITSHTIRGRTVIDI
jgi:hypothetical protein